MKIVVTGGDGFIGSQLTEVLVGEGHDVTVIDTLEANGGKYLCSGAKLVKASVTDASIWESFRDVEAVFHLAALPRIQPSITDPEKFHDTNVNGTFNVLCMIKDLGAPGARFIYSASSSAYGDQETLPLKEDMIPRPKNPYALQKLIGEMYCKLFSELYGMKTVCLRYFNVYGPRQAETGAYATVIGVFLKQWSKGKPLTIVPDGRQMRDFTHVADVVLANFAAMESPHVGGGEIINIGTGKEYSILELAEMIGGPTVFCEPRIAETRVTRADISKAKALLGWEPRISLADGIQVLKATLRKV